MGGFATLRRLPRMREDKEGAMAGSAAKVVISERQEKGLRKLSTATTLAKRLVQRASIILLAFSGVANRDIAKEVGLGRLQVGLWRRRWQGAFSNLIRIECSDDAGPHRPAWSATVQRSALFGAAAVAPTPDTEAGANRRALE